MLGGSPYDDDPIGVPPDARLIRRVNRKFCDWNALDAAGNPRVTSQAVQFYSEKMARPVRLSWACVIGNRRITRRPDHGIARTLPR